MRRLVCSLAVMFVGAPALAALPTYAVDVIEPNLGSFPFLEGHNELGQVVGGMTPPQGSQIEPFIASAGEGITFLPLPAGFIAGVAFDVNDLGVVVGGVSAEGIPFDLGEPAVWTPDGAGGYTVTLLTTLTIPPTDRGGGDDGGRAFRINNAGQIVGFTRISGRSGGPATQFFLDAPPVDLSAAGFTAEVRDLSETGVIAGGFAEGMRMDLDTGVITTFGVPPDLQPGNVNFTAAIPFAINDSGETIVAADCACGSNPPQNWLTYIHNDQDGYIRLNPNQFASRFVGDVYDNNNRGDVSAAGGVLFRDEGVLLSGYETLLTPAAQAEWDVFLGFIGNDRRVYALADNAVTGNLAIVQLTPQTSAADLNADGVVDGADLGVLLGAWGNGAGPTDLNADGVVDGADLGVLLGAWG